MTIPKLIGTLLFLTVAFYSHAGIGLGDWTCKTPCGSEINNNGDLSLYLKNGQVIKGLKKWYFYKDNLVGELNNNSYVAVNENTFTIDTFRTKYDWNKFIEKHKLKPSFWTRWYETDWKFFDEDLLFLAIVFFYFSIPLLILVIWISHKAIRFEKFNFKKPYTIVIVALIFFVLVNLLLEQFPQSI